MEPSLFSFIWKHSRRDQVLLLGLTLVTFPFLYATLELPKRIINDAIGAVSDTAQVLGFEVTQVQFLMVLCFAYLGAVLAHGLLKMRLNTMKGVVAERLLRRFRYQLIARMMRFPRSYFQTTSQGELVSMITSEAEPMGGLMGDAVAQPVFQAGQMLIIVTFLFLQSPWFGLAGVALIPLQAWLIPRLQRQINVLNKARITEVRHLSAEIGETAAGIIDLRTNGGWRLRLADFTDRLGRLFTIRFRIYQKKFFMKFINNFITQLTPFFFYAIGGYLAIVGQITVGALVAALAAYKDLSSPWKELLAYYNQTQDMALRWEVVTDRFGPRNAIDPALFDGTPDEIPHLRGDIHLQNVSVRNADGNMLLEDMTMTIPPGAHVAVQIANPSERQAFCEVLTREVLPARGRIEIAGHDLSQLHQAVIAARIGYAHSAPYIFQGTVRDNLLMPLMTGPKTVLWDPDHSDRTAIEAARAGNSPDSLKATWLDPGLADLATQEDIHDWWFGLTQAMGITEAIVRNMLNSPMDPQRHPELARRVLQLRPRIGEKLKAAKLDKAVHAFDPERFNPALPLGGNLIFASPLRPISQESLVEQKLFLSLVVEHGLAEQGIAISQTLVETLHQAFGNDGTDHPLFTMLGIDETLYEQLVDIAERRRTSGDKALTDHEFALLLTVPFAFTAEQIGPAFPESFKQEILDLRRTRGAALRDRMQDLFIPIAPDTYLPQLTVLENLIYGRISAMAGLQRDLIEDIVAEVLREQGLWQMLAVNLFDTPTTIGGSNLPAGFQQRLAFNRAAIKRPDIMIFNQSLAAYSTETRATIRTKLAEYLPETTQIYVDDKFANPETFDIYVEVRDGRIDGDEPTEPRADDAEVSDDLRRKLRIISRNDLFGSLDARSQRLLAFAARWYDAAPDQRIFTTGEPPDAAYLCLSGKAELAWHDEAGQSHSISEVTPGRLIGDLSIIMNESRQFDLTAVEQSRFLRLGAKEFMLVVENDRKILMTLLQTVASHLSGAADRIRSGSVGSPLDQLSGRGDATRPTSKKDPEA